MNARLKKITKIALWGWLCMLLALGGLPLQAQTPDTTLTVESYLAWEGYIRGSWWTEARVLLRNTGADWRGDLVVYDEQNQLTYRQALELPAHSYKQYRLPLFIGNHAIPSIFLRDDKGVQQEARLSVRGIDETERIVVLADTREAFARGQLGESGTFVWLSDLTGLPETPMAWDIIDVLLLNGISTAELTAAQQEALLAWVATGGHCIVGGGPALQQTLAHLPEALRIATPGNLRQFESLTVEEVTLYDVAATPLTLRATETSGAEAIPLITADGHIVAARGNVGKGMIDIIGWDMAHPAGAPWLAQLWSRDPVPAIRAWNNEMAISSVSPTAQTLFRIPFKTIPQFWPWLLLLPLYIFLMGPGTLVLVRRLKRPVLAWVFIPVWIFGAILILAFGLGSAFSQIFPLIHEVAIISVPDTTLPARVVQGTAIYAPRIQNLTWGTEGISRPLFGSYHTDRWYGSGDPFPIDAWRGNAAPVAHTGVTLQTHNPLGIITWGAEGVYDSPDIATNLKLIPLETANGALYVTGEVWSEATLRDVALLIGDNSYVITLTETLAQGATITVSRPITAMYTYYGSINLCGQPNYYTGYSTYPSYPYPASPFYMPSPAQACYLSGIIEGVPYPAQGLNGTHHQESCIIYAIPCPAHPPGKLTVTLEAMTNKIENGWFDMHTNTVYAQPSGATLYYMPPAYVQIQEVETLSLTLEPTDEPGSLNPLPDITAVSLWNWVEQAWMDYPPGEIEIAQLRIVLTGEMAQQTFDAHQGVRVHISTRDGVTAKLLLTLEGSP